MKKNKNLKGKDTRSIYSNIKYHKNSIRMTGCLKKKAKRTEEKSEGKILSPKTIKISVN